MLAKTVGIAAVAATVSGLAVYAVLDTRLKPVEEHIAHSPPVMVLDTSKLVERWVEMGRDEGVREEMRIVQQAVDKLTDAGYLILRADAAAGFAPALDLTESLPLKKQDSEQ